MRFLFGWSQGYMNDLQSLPLCYTFYTGGYCNILYIILYSLSTAIFSKIYLRTARMTKSAYFTFLLISMPQKMGKERDDLNERDENL